MKDGLLRVYMTTWENMEVLQDTIKWYKNQVPDCKFTIYDNMSTDLTVEMCNDLGCEVRSFNTGGTMNEAVLMRIRELSWLDPTHDSEHIIMCDDDERIMFKEEDLIDTDWNVNHCIGKEMIGVDGDKLEDIKFGCDSQGYSKKILWKRDEIQSMNFGAGSHSANPVPKSGYEIKYNPNPFMCLHCKWGYGWEKGVARQKRIAPRVDAESVRKRHNFHFALPEKLEEGQTGLNHWDYYTGGLRDRVQIIFP